MKIRYILYSLCILLGCICFSCTDMTDAPQPSDAETGLTIQLHTEDGQALTRATTNESRVQYLDIFIFDSTTGEVVGSGTDKCYWHFDNKDDGIVNDITLISGNWKTRFAGHEECDVYVIANLYAYSSEDSQDDKTLEAKLKAIQKLDDLKSLVESNPQIYQPTHNSKLPFAMSGYKLKWKPVESADMYTLSVNLTRLAAKIEIVLNFQFTNSTVTIGDKTYTYPTNQNMQNVLYSFQNYVINTLVFPEYDASFTPEVRQQQGETTVEQSETNIIAYTFPTSWSTDILKEAYVIVNAQLSRTEGGYLESYNNYYKIPLRLHSQEQKLERNHLYKVTANISALGNATPDNPVTLKDVTYKVAKWEDTNIEVGNDNPMYLELSEYEVVMRNVDKYDLTFASSSDIVSAEITNIYYNNKNGKPISVTNKEINATFEDGLNDTITIHSPVPENKTIRYMTLTVKNEQGLTETATIMQYPLEYITGISGQFSYLENDDRYQAPWPSGLTHLKFTSEDKEYKIDEDISKTIREGLNGHIGGQGKDNKVDMKCKFYIENKEGEGRIFRIDYTYDDKNPKYLDDNEEASNNQMYHVVITATSSDYTLARPIMDGEIVDPYNQDNDNLVSPSFMLASQLGNSSTISWSEAKDQCKNYVEVGEDGTVYDDWRLPTAAEINIIIKYQTDPNVNTKDDNAVMDYVLNYGGQNTPDYWVSRYNYSMQIPESGKGTLHEGKPNEGSNRRVRCVRDYRISDK